MMTRLLVRSSKSPAGESHYVDFSRAPVLVALGVKHCLRARVEKYSNLRPQSRRRRAEIMRCDGFHLKRWLPCRRHRALHKQIRIEKMFSTSAKGDAAKSAGNEYAQSEGQIAKTIEEQTAKSTFLIFGCTTSS